MKEKDLDKVVELFIRGENLANAVIDAMPDETTNAENINMCCYMLSLIKDEVYPEQTMTSFMLHIQATMVMWSLMRKKLAEIREREQNKTE